MLNAECQHAGTEQFGRHRSADGVGAHHAGAGLGCLQWACTLATMAGWPPSVGCASSRTSTESASPKRCTQDSRTLGRERRPRR